MEVSRGYDWWYFFCAIFPKSPAHCVSICRLLCIIEGFQLTSAHCYRRRLHTLLLGAPRPLEIPCSGAPSRRRLSRQEAGRSPWWDQLIQHRSAAIAPWFCEPGYVIAPINAVEWCRVFQCRKISGGSRRCRNGLVDKNPNQSWGIDAFVPWYLTASGFRQRFLLDSDSFEQTYLKSIERGSYFSYHPYYCHICLSKFRTGAGVCPLSSAQRWRNKGQLPARSLLDSLFILLLFYRWCHFQWLLS